MTAPFFPTIEQILDIFFVEIPQGVYPEDRADNTDFTKRSYSSSEIRAHAQLFANLYDNLENIYKDKFISTVTPDGLSPWELDLFADPQDPMQTFAQRQTNLLNKLRSTGGISYPAISTLIHSVLDPLSLTFDIIQYNGCGPNASEGAWILEVSILDVSTFLAAMDPLVGERRDLPPLRCDLDFAASGLTFDELTAIQDTAYTYEVRIFGNADAATLALLDKLLTQKEPARSTHIITNNALTPGWIDPDAIDGGPFLGANIDNFDFGTFTDDSGSFDDIDMGGF